VREKDRERERERERRLNADGSSVNGGSSGYNMKTISIFFLRPWETVYILLFYYYIPYTAYGRTMKYTRI